MLLKINQNEIWTQMLGEFNAYNILAVYATTQLLGHDELEKLEIHKSIKKCPWEVSNFETPDKIMVVVDYAHTPDALKNVLMTINKIRTQNESLITVVGCGGNRDQEKDPDGRHSRRIEYQGAIYLRQPRDEDPDSIIEQMCEGVDPVDFKKTMSITCRKEAIKVACQLSQPEMWYSSLEKDTKTTRRLGEKLPFDDYKIAKKYFLKRLSSCCTIYSNF